MVFEESIDLSEVSYTLGLININTNNSFFRITIKKINLFAVMERVRMIYYTKVEVLE